MTQDVVIFGASGYTGAQLCALLAAHPEVNLKGLYVSAGSADKGRSIAELYGRLRGRCEQKLQALADDEELPAAQAAFLCTSHEVSHALAPRLIEKGMTVYDLSGAFRLSDAEIFRRSYGFDHLHMDLQRRAVYALAEYVSRAQLEATPLVSLPGCYPTAAQLALRPLLDYGLIDAEIPPVINAVSGVSGAGRKASLTHSFCEVSLAPYGLFTHRHRPEIEEHLGCKVIFNAHLGNFKRGILETITVRLRPGVSDRQLDDAYGRAYDGSPLVRRRADLPRLQDVQGLPYCDLGWRAADGYAVVVAAIDNLMKGAAAQAVQVFNLREGLPPTLALVPEAHSA